MNGANNKNGNGITAKESRNGVGEVGPETPPMPESKGMAWDYFFMMENMPGPSLNEDDIIHNYNHQNNNNNIDGVDVNVTPFADAKIETHNVNVGPHSGGGGGGVEIEPKTPEKVVEQKFFEEEDAKKEKQIEHAKTAPADFRRLGKALRAPPVGVSWTKILTDLDEHFLSASERAQEVSKMLEATRLHYHSNFADNWGHINHSERVMRVITWNKSFKGISNGEGGKDDFDSEEYETHATVLDKLLAWERKLYEEVKVHCIVFFGRKKEKARSMVSFVAISLGNLVIEEVTFLKGVSQQVKQIGIELKWMQCFLKEADKRQNENESIQNWVSEIREAAYDVQDVIETFTLEIASKNKENPLKRHVPIFKGRKIHKVGSKIEAIKTRISDLTGSLQTYGVNAIKEDGLGSAFDRQRQLRWSYSHIVEDKRRDVWWSSTIFGALRHGIYLVRLSHQDR
ncbi:nitrate regulatory gene2 protein [Fagus crenata]